MFGLGALSSVLSRKFTNKVMTFGAVLVVVLGISMLNTGLGLFGISAYAMTPLDSNDAIIEDGIQSITTPFEKSYTFIDISTHW